MITGLFPVVNSLSWASGIDWLADRLSSVGEIFTALVAPAVAAIAAAIAVTMLAMGFRRLCLRWRGRSPRVQITPFAWAAAGERDREAAWVTSLFREQLGALRLDPLDPLPERAPSAPLVEIVEGVGQGVGHGLDIGKAIGRFWRAVWPDAAYEVWGTLRPLEGGGGGISVQLVDRRRRNRTLISVVLNDTDWEQCARQAAMAVAGALYPQVRKRHKGPWTLWTEPVPRGLISDYHDAREHEEGNRLEQAMGAYHDALSRDPLNPNLRLRIAMLQERLALSLDAWVTYRAITDESDRDAWRGPDRRVRLLALYRLAILLGNARMAEQWVKRGGPDESDRNERDEERGKLREELTSALKGDRLFTTGERPRWSGPAAASSVGLLKELRESEGQTKGKKGDWICEWFAPQGTKGKNGKKCTRRIGEMLQIISLRHLEELDAWLRARPPWRPRQWRGWWLHRPPVKQWWRRREFASSAVRVSKLLIRIRIAASVECRLRPTQQSGAEQLSSSAIDKAIDEVHEEHQELTRRWPFPPVGFWRSTVHFLAPRRRWANGRSDARQLHYNAACAAASVLLDDSVLCNAKKEKREGSVLPGETTEDKIVRRAVDELEEYAHRAGSDQVAAQADWVAIDDPDLEGLAKRKEFKLWASHHLPRGLPDERPHRNIDINRYIARMVHRGACAFADSWRARANNDTASAEAVAGWWRAERVAWMKLREFCWERRSWCRRLDVLEALESWLQAAESSHRIDFGHEARDHTVASEKMTDGLFEEIAKLVGNEVSPRKSTPATVLCWVHRRAEHVGAMYEAGTSKVGWRKRGLAAKNERKEALRVARIWTRLADVLEAELKGRSNGEAGEDPETLLQPIREELPRSIRR